MLRRKVFIALLVTTSLELVVLLCLAVNWHIQRVAAVESIICYTRESFVSSGGNDELFNGLEKRDDKYCGVLSDVLYRITKKEKTVVEKYNTNLRPELTNLILTTVGYIPSQENKPILQLENIASHATPDYRHEEYSFRVKILLYELERDFAMAATVEKARAKLKGVMFETWSQKKQYAALIINLYTSSDEITDAPSNTLYSSLNTELRRNNTGEIWQRYEALLNEALDIIGKDTFEHLYRGEWNWTASFPDVGESYYIRSFWSTTIDPSITEYFGGKTDFFYHIIGAKGVRIQNISVTDDEKEVLISSARDYILVRITSDQKDIHKEMEWIRTISSGFDVTKFKPMVLITLMEKSLYSKTSPSTTTSGQYVSTESAANIDNGLTMQTDVNHT